MLLPVSWFTADFIRRDRMNSPAGGGIVTALTGLCSAEPVRDGRQANRRAALSRALAASTSRFFGAADVTRASSSRVADSVISLMASSKAASLAFDGRAEPLSLRTNCSAEARISASLAGGSKLNRVLMFLHMVLPSVWSESA
tara:strand:- start:1746 stop:2174 length:429 start_codon:yes stop_codon:yes gene_type:complete